MKVPGKIQRGLLVFLAVIVLYVGLYCCLSARGSYQFMQTGRIRYGFGLSVSDVSMWQPEFIRWQQFTNVEGSATTRGNILGYVFCPLIILDRWLVHPTEVLIGADS
jgi:hypothetical protein